MRNAGLGLLAALVIAGAGIALGTHDASAADPQQGVWIFTLFRDPSNSVLVERTLPCEVLPRRIDRFVERFNDRSRLLRIEVDASNCAPR